LVGWLVDSGFVQLNPDKSKALVVGTSHQLRADEMKVLGVFLDRRLAFDKHVSAVARSCNYHIQAIRHKRHLLTTELA